MTTADGPASYAWIQGTSMAAPHVTGVGGLVKQLHPGWSPSAVAAAAEADGHPDGVPG